jgi:hypothetical protein
LRVEGFSFRVEGLEFRVSDSRFRGWNGGFRVDNLGFIGWVQGLGLRVEGERLIFGGSAPQNAHIYVYIHTYIYAYIYKDIYYISANIYPRGGSQETIPRLTSQLRGTNMSTLEQKRGWSCLIFGGSARRMPPNAHNRLFLS